MYRLQLLLKKNIYLKSLLHDTHCYLEFMLFKCHTIKEQSQVPLLAGIKLLCP